MSALMDQYICLIIVLQVTSMTRDPLHPGACEMAKVKGGQGVTEWAVGADQVSLRGSLRLTAAEGGSSGGVVWTGPSY